MVSIYIDNSFSMDALSSKGRLFDEAKGKAIEISSTYKSSDLFQILTNDFEDKHQQFVSKEEFIDIVENIQISPSVKTLSEVIARQQDLLSSNNNPTNKTIFIISDFQRSSVNINQLVNNTNTNIFFIPIISNKTNNLYIDSCWFESPVLQIEQNIKLITRIKNNSDENFENAPVKLVINNQQKAITSVTINANSETDIIMPYTIREKGVCNGILSITDYPITYDDYLYFSYHVSDNIPILSINGEDESIYLNSLFNNDSIFSFINSSEKNIDYSSFSNYKLIILNELKNLSSGLAQQLETFINNGGSIIIFPDIKADLISYKKFLILLNANYYTELDTFDTKIENINLNHQIYQNVFEKIPDNINLPSVFSHYTINKSTHSNEEYLLKMLNKKNFLSVQSIEKGNLYLCAVPLNTDFSNFVKHPVFVPTLYKIALLSNPLSKLFYTIGNNEVIELKNIKLNGENIFKIKKSDSNFEIIPEHKNVGYQTNIYTHNQLKEAGNYVISIGNENIQGISYNYDRKESNLKCYQPDELSDLINKNNLLNYSIIENQNHPLTKILTELNQGIQLWKLFIILALFFLAVEIILLRLLK